MAPKANEKCQLGFRILFLSWLGNSLIPVVICLKHGLLDQVHYWMDSTNCLLRITSHSSVSKAFISNRVGEIKNESKPEMWRHIPTEQNPADVPTRFPKEDGLKKSDLMEERTRLPLESQNPRASKVFTYT
jgi:hypothetical protein